MSLKGYKTISQLGNKKNGIAFLKRRRKGDFIKYYKKNIRHKESGKILFSNSTHKKKKKSERNCTHVCSYCVIFLSCLIDRTG